MDIKQLQYFITVVEEGTISKAAKKLFMSQPPLSLQMKALEQEIKGPLFKRGQRQIQLTEAGRYLYQKALTIVEMSKITIDEVRGYAQDAAGTIRIGIVSSVVNPQAVGWISAFSQLHPQLHFAIDESNTYELIEKLQTNIIQLALVRTPYTADKLTVQPLISEALVAIREHAANEQPTAKLAELAQQKLIIYRRWERVLQDEFNARQLIMRPAFLCDDARTVVDLVEKGCGTGIVPLSATLALKQPNIIIQTITDCLITSRIDLIQPEHPYRNAYVEEFRQFIIQQCQ